MINAAKNINKETLQAIENKALVTSSGLVSSAANVVPFPGSNFQKGETSQLVCSWKGVYQQNLIRHQSDKWVMVINANKAQLKALSILENTNNMLAVNPKKEVKFATLINTIKAGNCSTLMIADQQFSEQQLRLLTITAEQHDCRCIVIEEEMNLMAVAH